MIYSLIAMATVMTVVWTPSLTVSAPAKAPHESTAQGLTAPEGMPTAGALVQFPTIKYSAIMTGYDCPVDVINALTGEQYSKCCQQRWTDERSEFITKERICCYRWDVYKVCEKLMKSKCKRNVTVGQTLFDTNEWDVKHPCRQDVPALGEQFCRRVQPQRPLDDKCRRLYGQIGAYGGDNSPTDPSADSHRPSTGFFVLLTAIVVSIAVYVYGF